MNFPIKALISPMLVAVPLLSLASAQKTVGLDMAPPVAIQNAIRVGAPRRTQVLHIAVSLPLANEKALEAYVNAVSNPKSPMYRHFLTPEQVGQQYGLTQSQVEKVTKYLTSQGMKITLVAKNRLSILADATVDQAQKAFHTTIQGFATKDQSDPYRFSFTNIPSVPAELRKLITNVSGLENFTRPRGHYVSPTQVRTLYGTATMYAGGSKGQGRTIGISSWDGFRLANASGFISSYGLPTPAGGALSNITVKTLDGGSGTGAANLEGDLDIQCTLAVAPLANITIYDGKGGDIINVLTQEANDNTADIITESYGWNLPTATATSAHTIHLSMSAQGITYLAATGDSGTTINPYSYPDYEPEVLLVGGTSVTTNTAGNRTTETGWTGSGGGWTTTATNTFNVKAPFQTTVGPSGVNYRLSPDIAANADPNTGYTIYLTPGTYGTSTITTAGVYNGVGGTSAASPTVAASLADAEQQIISQGGLPANSAGKQRFGRIADLLYSYNGDSSVFFDVTSGTNGTLANGTTSNAATGWDTVTGWGAINFDGLVTKVLGTPITSAVSSISVASSSLYGGLGTSVSGTVTLTSAAPTGGSVVTLSASSSSVSLSSASVTIPAGQITGSFSFTAAAVNASTSVTFTATLGTKSVTTTATILPAVLSSVSVSPTSVTSGTSATLTATLNAPAGPAGTVVTVSSSNTSAAKFAVASVTVPAGATTATVSVTTLGVNSNTFVTLTGTSGVAKTASLTVNAATLSGLSVSPTTVKGNSSNVVAGTVTLNGLAGSSGATVALKSSNSTVAPVASSVKVASGTSTITFTFKPTKPSVNTTVTITATYGSTSKTATLTVTP